MTKIVKRGRPVGSKNQPKRYEISATQIKLAEKLGISREQYAHELHKRNLLKPVKTDWQKLAKQLQEALESQIHDYQLLESRMEVVQKESDEIAESHRRYLTVISYLETKLGLNSV